MRNRAVAFLILAGLAAVALLHPTAVPPGPRPSGLVLPDVPAWSIGDTWTFQTHAVTRDGLNWTDAWNNLTSRVSARIVAVQDGAYLYLFNSSTAGDLSATGEVLIPGTGSTTRYMFTSSNVRGYVWNERGDLAMARTNETFSGSGMAVLPLFGSRPLTAAGNLTVVYRPPEEDFDFPIKIGDSWRVSTTLNSTGTLHLRIDLPVGFQDIDILQPLSGDSPFDSRYWANTTETVAVPAGSFDAARITSLSSNGTFATRWYAQNASNYVKLETHSVSGPSNYTHTWTNLTSYALVNPFVAVSVVLVPDAVGPGGSFQIFANTSAPNTPLWVIIPATNFTTSGSTDAAGRFRQTVIAPATNDDTPANADMGSHGVLVDLLAFNRSGFGAATISLIRPDLTVDGLTASPLPVADGVPTALTTTASVTTDVPVYSPVEVTFVAEDVDLDRDGVMDRPIDAYCGRSACTTTNVSPLLPGFPVDASATWVPSPPSLPASIRVSAVIDPHNAYDETNEANDIVVTTIRVEGPDLTPTNVTVDAGGVPYVFDRPASQGFVSPVISLAPSTRVSLTLRVANVGLVNVTRSTTVAYYNTTTLNGTGDPPFAQVALGPVDAGVEAGLAAVPWNAPAAPGTYFVNLTADYRKEVRETYETNNTFVLRFRVYDLASAPDLVPVSIAIPPKASANRVVWVSARVSNVGASDTSGFQVGFYNDTQRSTPFARFNVGPLGSGATSSVLSAPWSSPALGPHLVWIEVDYGDAVPESNESNNTASGTVTVYDVSVTTLTIGTPRIVTNTTYILPTTPLSLAATDRTGEGAPTIWYKVDSGPWGSVPAGLPFTLPAGPHTISYNSTDLLGGVEPTHAATVFVDALPPETTASVSNGTGGKLVTFTAVDLASGVNWTEYRIDGGTWNRFTGTPVPVSGAGNHSVEFRSADRLGNLEPAKRIAVHVEGVPAGPSAGFNVKPGLALLFAATLLLAGWFAAPSPDPPRRRRWFLLTAVPPAVIELATGASSLIVREMAVPGGSLGLPIDVALLLVGLLLILFLRRRALGSAGTDEDLPPPVGP